VEVQGGLTLAVEISMCRHAETDGFDRLNALVGAEVLLEVNFCCQLPASGFQRFRPAAGRS
jgi:hypothetical protein